MKHNQMRQVVFPILAAFIWGTAFVAQDMCADSIGAFAFNASRYFIAVLALLVVIVISDKLKKDKPVLSPAEKKAANRQLWLGGLCCGAALAMASNFQQAGMVAGTDSGKAGFLTALYVVLVPVCGLFFKRKVSLPVWIAVALSVIALYLLCINGEFSLAPGDLLILACAVCFTIHILVIDHFTATVDGVKLLDKVYFSVNRGDKIAFVGENELAQTALFKILMGELEPDEGSVKWGVSTIRSYLPKDNSPYFDGNQMELVDWLRQYSAKKDDVYLRGFLGRMLFSNEDVFKPVNVLSGGEKVRCMLSRMMLSGANVVLLDQPTNHLDMESIQAVNKGLEAFPGVVLLASHDHELLTSTCNRVIAFQPDGTIIDKYGTYDDYLAWMAERRQQG